jgi:tRNA(Ile)-lysidine synthase
MSFPDVPGSEALLCYPKKRSYLVGVSGGRDSMALLHALWDCGFRKLVVCHFDHGLRPAKRELALVERETERLGLPLELGVVDTAAHAKTTGVSIEVAARDLRYKFFEACAKARRCHRLFLGHHADDQMETQLLNLFRGTGLAGLIGMHGEARMRSLTLLRPWLHVMRSEITAYVKTQRIAYFEDPSNTSLAHTRNRLRHNVLPVIEDAFGPSYRRALMRLSELALAEEAYLASQVPDPEEQLSTSALKALPLALRRRLVHAWLVGQGIRDSGFAEVQAVLSLLDGQTAKVNLPGDRHARRRSGVIFLE